MKNRKIRLVLFLLFLAVSLLFIDPKEKPARSQFHSSQLNKITTRHENTERTDYRDEDGNITIAADLGYATMAVTQTENRRLEQYFDDRGEPISRYSGYYAVLRECDERGNNIRNTYLDLQGNPIVMASGYATEEREYNENRQVVAVRYCDAEGNPARTPSYGYGRRYEYGEDGRARRIIYVDASGAPMMTGQGYAIVSRNYYNTEGPENGKVESEFYFDEAGNPVSLSLGQYGVHKEYDESGRESLWTYLDAAGNPTVTNKGYTTVRRTFQANNSVATERYFDMEGNPFSLSEGQYGVNKENGKTVYLDRAGAKTFNLKNLLYNRSRLAVLFALFLVAVSALADRKVNLLFLALYVVAIGYLTVMYRESGNSQVRTELFWSYKAMFTDDTARSDNLRNIWLFIPLGAFLYRVYPKKRILLVPVVLSALVEAVQYFTGTGLCELDDVISNGLGGAIGYGMGDMLREAKDRMRLRRAS